MKKIECDICKKIVDEKDAYEVRMGVIANWDNDKIGEVCNECADKLKAKIGG